MRYRDIRLPYLCRKELTMIPPVQRYGSRFHMLPPDTEDKSVELKNKKK